jgi:hypothetical protein
MKRNTALIGAAAAAAAATCLVACGGNGSSGSSSMPPPTTLPSQLDTAQVLLLAQRTSEVSSPMLVNGGALEFTDTSDTAAAISVNGM